MDPATNAKFEASFFGGTADGRFVALLARTPGLPTAKRAALKAHMRALGFDNSFEEVGAPPP